MPSLEGKKMFLYIAPKKSGTVKKSQQAIDRERREADGLAAAAKAEEVVLDEDVETPANGGLLANAKISLEDLQKLTQAGEE
jgi:translation initiation factor IF-3